MEKEYDWTAILIGVIPILIGVYFIFNSGLTWNTKFILLFVGMILSGGITFIRNKKKHNIFTASALVFLIAMIYYGLLRLDYI